ncbi:MAG: DUF2975 domain-containing protein [Oscillospiraceae bacterium]|nr:DUF2975 domain-containing protein [Oscillospiraceae bacterium]
MWTDSRSLNLSKIFTMIFMVLLVACMIAAPWMVTRLLSMSQPAQNAGSTLFLISIYIGSVPAATLLALLYALLHQIGSGHVFIAENVAYLRYISWCCFAGAVICIASGFYYIPWFAPGIAAAFVGLIIRVIKNVVAEAVTLQDESDLTI